MITYSVLIDNIFQCSVQASSRTEAVQKAQVYKTDCMQRIHVQKPDFVVTL